MKVLITGEAGFISSHIVDALVGRGDTVVCVDDFNNYHNPAIKRINIKNALASSNTPPCNQANRLSPSPMSRKRKTSCASNTEHLSR